ncbi:hypothetical protein [Demequina sp. NBRC 110053]|uniref:hypothetical protein n=1 Tax=Demequina sp. NBRC 110053 TaxID=1570342 RepID=UPI0009FF7E11|nr:hypothetical protein [Demequina sp. NBRC 110053]
MLRPVVPALVALAVVAGCSAAPADGPGSSMPATPLGGATEGAAAGEIAVPSPGAHASTGDAADMGGGSDVAAGSDLFCAPAQAGITSTKELLDATDRKSEQTGIEDDGGDVALMNAAGEDMLAHAADAQAEWAEARGLLDAPGWVESSAPLTTAEVEAALDEYESYMEAWVVPEARIAAESSSIAQYDQATLALLGAPDVIDAAAAGGEALGTLLGYTGLRCGEIDALG